MKLTAGKKMGYHFHISHYRLVWLFFLSLNTSFTVDAAAAADYQQLKVFGNPDQSGRDLESPLVQTFDGNLYGVTYQGGSNSFGTLFRLNPNGTSYGIVHHFGTGTNDGRNPWGALVQLYDGVLYGTTEFGGSNGFGTMFRIQTNGLNYIIVRHFGAPGEGQRPRGTLHKGPANLFYGTTYAGGASGFGTIYSIDTETGAYQLLHSFSGTGTEGKNPWGGVINGGDFRLYGTTDLGGSANRGTVFRMDTNGANFTTILSFTTSGPQNPRSALVVGIDLVLYGTTEYTSGIYPYGSIFKVNRDGSGYAVLHSFIGNDGLAPRGSLIEASDLMLYGVCSGGPYPGGGTVFRLAKNGSAFQTLQVFGDPNSPRNPYAALIEASGGDLYGVCSDGGTWSDGTVFHMKKDGTSFNVVRHFRNAGNDPNQPFGPLVFGSDGALYGVTAIGGTNDQGVLYKLNTNGTGYSLLHTFGTPGTNFGDGYTPSGPLLKAGALFGVTEYGGTNGSGTVYRINENGSGYATLRNFQASADGQFPRGSLAIGANNFLYGVAQGGGAYNKGTAFRLATNGNSFAVLHNFGAGTADGWSPFGGIMRASDGFFYGFTSVGGISNIGTIYRINEDGTDYRTLYQFGSTAGDRSYPNSVPIEIAGVLYGQSTSGGAPGQGTIFKINRDGTGYQVIRALTITDGAQPYGPLLESIDGLLYGANYTLGGGSNVGNVFCIGKDGNSFSVLRSFLRGPDGAKPKGGLIEAPDGSQYGTTQIGGNYLAGTVFRINPVHPPNLLTVTQKFGIKWAVLKGLPGRQYDVQRSDDFSTWYSLGIFTMPASGTYSSPDPGAPPDNAFYRAVLLP